MQVATPLSIDLKQTLDAGQLPALPQTAMRLLELSQDPDNGPAEFAVPIESEPGLTSQVLRFVNSSHFGFSQEISNVKQAITLVGISTIMNFALWNAVFNLMPDPKCGPLRLSCLWQDSLRRALFARMTAKLLGMAEAEELFAAALLQDMAIPLLAKELPDVYQRLLEARSDGQVRLSALEHQLLGWNHAEAAGIAARLWNFPEHFAALLEGHHAVDRWAQQPGANLGRLLVAASGLLPSTTDSTWYECERFQACYQKVSPNRGPSIPRLLEQIDEQFGELAPFLDVSLPDKPLIDSFHEAVADPAA